MINVFASKKSADEVRAAIEKFSRDGGNIKEMRWSDETCSATLLVSEETIEFVVPVIETIRRIAGVSKASIAAAL